MLDPIITRYKLTTNVCSYLLEHSQYPVNTTYNTIRSLKEKNHNSLKFWIHVLPQPFKNKNVNKNFVQRLFGWLVQTKSKSVRPMSH